MVSIEKLEHVLKVSASLLGLLAADERHRVHRAGAVRVEFERLVGNVDKLFNGHGLRQTGLSKHLSHDRRLGKVAGNVAQDVGNVGRAVVDDAKHVVRVAQIVLCKDDLVAANFFFFKCLF